MNETGDLAGLRVLDLRNFRGQFFGRILGDLVAEVLSGELPRGAGGGPRPAPAGLAPRRSPGPALVASFGGATVAVHPGGRHGRRTPRATIRRSG